MSEITTASANASFITSVEMATDPEAFGRGSRFHPDNASFITGQIVQVDGGSSEMA